MDRNGSAVAVHRRVDATLAARASTNLSNGERSSRPVTQRRSSVSTVFSPSLGIGRLFRLRRAVGELRFVRGMDAGSPRTAGARTRLDGHLRTSADGYERERVTGIGPAFSAWEGGSGGCRRASANNMCRPECACERRRAGRMAAAAGCSRDARGRVRAAIQNRTKPDVSRPETPTGSNPAARQDRRPGRH
jgi:hypothetical protein